MYPVWSRSGRSLYFRRPGQVVEVPVLPGAQLTVGTQRSFTVSIEYRTAFDVTPDGQGFLMVGPVAAGAPP